MLSLSLQSVDIDAHLTPCPYSHERCATARFYYFLRIRSRAVMSLQALVLFLYIYTRIYNMPSLQSADRDARLASCPYSHADPP